MGMDEKMMMGMDEKMMHMMMGMDEKMMSMMMNSDEKMMSMMMGDQKMMMPMMSSKKMRCCCGSVEMEIMGEPKMCAVCHCDDCQKASGAACVANAFFDPAMVKVTKGMNDLVEFKLKTMPRMHCKMCHNFMFSTTMGMVAVNGNMYPGYKPSVHFHCRFAKMMSMMMGMDEKMMPMMKSEKMMPMMTGDQKMMPMMMGDQKMMPMMMGDQKMMPMMMGDQKMMMAEQKMMPMMMGDKKMMMADQKMMPMMMGDQKMMMADQKMMMPIMSCKKMMCGCGAVEMEVMGEPKISAVCHCDDCQRASGAACVAGAYFDPAMVKVTKGMNDLVEFKLKTMPRMHCMKCHNFMFSTTMGMIAVNGNMYPGYKPAVHIQCRYAKMKVLDGTPKYFNTPMELGGDGVTCK